MVLALGFLLLFIIGYLLLDLLTSDLTSEEKMSLSYSMGIGFISFLMFMMFYFKLLHSKTQLIILMLLISIVLFTIRHMIKKKAVDNLKHFGSRTIFFKQWNYKLYLIIFPLFIFSLIFSYYYPIMIFDGIDYEVAGRLMTLSKAVEPENYFRPYPPLIPVAYSFTYFLGGIHPKIIFSLFYLSLVICFYFRLSAWGLNKSSSLVFTLILATTPYTFWHSFLGILDLTAAYYFSIATLFWFSHLRNISESGDESRINCSHPLLAGIFYSLSIFTRFEMLVYFLIPLIFTALYSLKYHILKNVLYLALPSLFISSFWFFSSYKLVSGEDFKIFSIAIIILIIAVVLLYFIILKKGYDNIIGFIDRCEMRAFYLVKVIGLSFAIFLIVCVFIPQDMQSNLYFVNQLTFFIKTLITRSIAFIFGNIFFLSTSVLIMLFPVIEYKVFRREYIYLFVFIISFLLFNIIMFSYLYFFDYISDSIARSYDLMKFLNNIVYHPGKVISSAQIRGLLPIYPVIIFFFAISRRIQKAFEV